MVVDCWPMGATILSCTPEDEAGSWVLLGTKRPYSFFLYMVVRKNSKS